MSLLQAASEGRLPRGNREPQASVHRDILEQLVARAPATIPVAELTRNTGAVASAEAMIMEAWMSGFVQFRTKPISATPTASTRPEAFALARLQARTRESVTNLRHEAIRLTDSLTLTLLTLLDGTRDRDAMISALAAGGAFGNASAVAIRVDDALTSFARFGLLIR